MIFLLASLMIATSIDGYISSCHISSRPSSGQTDMQLSTFLRIADALGLRFSLVLG